LPSQVLQLGNLTFVIKKPHSLFSRIAATPGGTLAFLLTLPASIGAADVNGIPTFPPAIAGVMKKVNTWQLEHPWKPEDRNWIRATWYTGVMAAFDATRDEDYLKQSLAWAKKHEWQPGNEPSGANVLTCGQTYLELWFLRHEPERIAPTVAWLNSGAASTPSGARAWYLEGGQCYADSLYVAPPTLAMLAKATGDHKYVNWMNAFYWDVYDELFAPDEQLFYRDKRFIGAKTANGRKVIWSRGNGWVFAGLPRILHYLPEDDPSYGRYEALFKTMAAAIARCQGKDGLWRANLADPAEYPSPETSGTGFFIYGLAWGLNQGVLAQDTCLPVVRKAWAGLAGCVSDEGKVQWGQKVGDRPAAVQQADTHEYVTGSFLLAASEMLRLARSGLLTGPTSPSNGAGGKQP
jgi:rhamnogalacturonyl hydrolase YesR